MENPFIPAVMAYFLASEQITRKEIIVYLIATVGLYCISAKEGALQLHAAGSKD